MVAQQLRSLQALCLYLLLRSHLQDDVFRLSTTVVYRIESTSQL